MSPTLRNGERILRLLIGATVLLAVCTAGTAFNSDAAETVWLRDQAFKIAFAYRAPWRPVQAIESATSHKVKWEAKGGGLVATCYLQSYDNAKGKYWNASQLVTNEKEIVASAMRHMAVRLPRNRLISSQSSTIDGQPVIFIVRDGEGDNLGKAVGGRSWLVITVWSHQWINFECGSPIPYQFPGDPLVEVVEKEVYRIIRTLHFER